ncbi:MAG: methyltransferase domain-containing protein [Dehalococcoidia bacterium]|nr:methyltransferase domain-containing protein [Dehalococcoidia bacterium]
MTTQTTQIDQAKLESLIGRAVDDLGATSSAALVVIGDKLGLYRALGDLGPATPEDLAAATGTSARYLRHWLLNQASAGYVDYSPGTGRYSLTPEQAMVFADDESPYSMVGGFGLVTAAIKAEPRIAEAVRSGGGMPWGEHDEGLFRGTERFFKPGYIGNIAQSWIPSLSGVREALQDGGTVADVGCGFGASTVIMAQAYPRSRFLGFDSHQPSIEAAREAAAAAGVGDRVTFDVATAQEFTGREYDLVTFFDCLHDMGDPTGAARHAHEALKAGGSVMLVEPMAGDTVEANLNPVGRIFSAASVLICSPHAIAEGGRALGTIATDAELATVFNDAGYDSFRRATETPTNRVFEART